jgi:hypothetical protein
LHAAVQEQYTLEALLIPNKCVTIPLAQNQEGQKKSRASEKLGFFILNSPALELCLQEGEPILLYLALPTGAF